MNIEIQEYVAERQAEEDQQVAELLGKSYVELDLLLRPLLRAWRIARMGEQSTRYTDAKNRRPALTTEPGRVQRDRLREVAEQVQRDMLREWSEVAEQELQELFTELATERDQDWETAWQRAVARSPLTLP